MCIRDRCTLCNAHYALHTLHTMQCTVCNAQYAMHSMRCNQCYALDAMHTVQFRNTCCGPHSLTSFSLRKQLQRAPLLMLHQFPTRGVEQMSLVWDFCYNETFRCTCFCKFIKKYAMFLLIWEPQECWKQLRHVFSQYFIYIYTHMFNDFCKLCDFGDFPLL